MSIADDQRLTECLRRARDGDDSVWTEIDDRLRHDIVTKLRFPPDVDPDEVATDALSDVWQALRSVRDDQKIVGFALTVARRVAARKHREATRHVPLLCDPPARIEDIAERNAAGDELLGRLAEPLAAFDRKLFRLLYVLGASKAELEQELGLSGSRLRKRKFMLREKLRRSHDVRRGFDLL